MDIRWLFETDCEYLSEYLRRPDIDVNRRDIYGKTLAIYAAQTGKSQHLIEILKFRPNLDVTDSDGKTALMYAAYQPHIGNVDRLLKHGANSNLVNKNGQTALILATYQSSEKCVELLIKHNADANVIDKSNNTALTIAVSKYDVELVDIILQADIDLNNLKVALNIAKKKELNTIASKIETALLLAEERDRTSSLSKAVKDMTLPNKLNLADVDVVVNQQRCNDNIEVQGYKREMENIHMTTSSDSFKGNYTKSVSLYSMGASMRCDVNTTYTRSGSTVFDSSIKKEDPVQLMKIRDSKHSSLTARDGSNSLTAGNNHSQFDISSLLLAAYHGRVDILSSIIQHDADINTADNRGTTALMFAVLANSPESITFLLENGASLNMKDNNGDTAMDIAIYSGYQKCVDVLKRHMFNECGDWGSQLVLAVENNHIQCITSILKSGVDVNVRNDKGETPLISAILKQNKEIFDVLLNEGASVNFLAGEGKSPLMAAAWVGNTYFLDKLIQLKAYPDYQDFEGFTALMFSCMKGHVECVEKLLDYGVNTKKYARSKDTKGRAECVDKSLGYGVNNTSCTPSGDTALSIATQNEHSECVFLLDHYNMHKAVLLPKSTLNVHSSLFTELILTATQNGYGYCLEKYLKAGASTDDKNKALLFASSTGRLNILEMLINHGANVNVYDEFYKVTPLMECAINNHIDCLKLLIKHKASINTQNSSGATALILSAIHGSEDCLSELIKYNASIDAKDNNEECV
ncbi:ankyrin repeat domain-containing protein 50-like [Physella acuta]|uniref:ankyrin repeat domain-containing protein 50-like n=1 Tax=Physella acuta TaxID=109671 RepID=UPI0027DB93B1|nr:ankyrin repeat domain-containing protein 50-like [Physella acuta]